MLELEPEVGQEEEEEEEEVGGCSTSLSDCSLSIDRGWRGFSSLSLC